MRRIKLATLAMVVLFVVGLLAAEAASAANLGPAEVVVSTFGAIEPGKEVEFEILNLTEEVVKVTNIAIDPEVPPMKLELGKPKRGPECKVKTELAKNAKCFALVKNGAAVPGGTALYVIQAEGAKKWETKISAF